MTTIRLAIADDHPMIVNGIKNMLHYYRHLEIVQAYGSGRALLQGLQTVQPDVLLLDIQLPDISGNELARLIVRDYPKVKILVITSMDSTFHIKDMMKAGCRGYLLKTADKDKLMEAITEVYAGGTYLETSLKDQLLQEVFHKKNVTVTTLTRREKEILNLIAKELTSPEIAALLSISQRTVENHRFSLMQKLQAKNTVSLIRIASASGLI